jgi:hypothetical protein
VATIEELAELYAAARQARVYHAQALGEIPCLVGAYRVACVGSVNAGDIAYWTADLVGLEVKGGPNWSNAQRAECAAQAALLRDLFGPLPFRPVSIPQSVRAWHDATIQRLAEASYANRQLPSGTLEPEGLCVLADALEEAGCTDEDVLAHLRSPGPHDERQLYFPAGDN